MPEEKFIDIIKIIQDYLVNGHPSNLGIIINRHPETLLKIMKLEVLLEGEKSGNLSTKNLSDLQAEILFRFLVKRDFTSKELMDFLNRNLPPRHLFFDLVGPKGILTKGNEDVFKETIMKNAADFKVTDTSHFTTRALELVIKYYNCNNNDSDSNKIYWFNVLTVLEHGIQNEIAKWFEPGLCIRLGVTTSDASCPKGYKPLSQMTQYAKDLEKINSEVMEYCSKTLGMNTKGFKIFVPNIVETMPLDGNSLGFGLLGAVYLASKGISLPNNYVLMGEVDFEKDKIGAVEGISEKIESAINSGIKVLCVAEDGISKKDEKLLDSSLNSGIDKIFRFDPTKSIKESLAKLKSTLFPFWYKVFGWIKVGVIILIFCILLEQLLRENILFIAESLKGDSSNYQPQIPIFDKLMSLGDNIQNKVLSYGVIFLYQIPLVIMGLFLIIWVPFLIGKSFNNVLQEIIDYFFLGKARHHKPLIDTDVNPQWKSTREWFKKTDKYRFYYLTIGLRYLVAYLSFMIISVILIYLIGFLEQSVGSIIDKIPLISIIIIIGIIGVVSVLFIFYGILLLAIYIFTLLEPLSRRFKPHKLQRR